MKKHTTPDAIQAEIRKLENKYATLFSRSDLKGLIPVKKNLDELKAQLKELESCRENAEAVALPVVINHHLVERSNTDNPAFGTLKVDRRGSRKKNKISDAGMVLKGFLQLLCPECDEELKLDDATESVRYMCSNLHSFTKDELVSLFSRRIHLAINDFVSPAGDIKVEESVPAMSQRIEILQNVLGIINANLRFGV
jgi:hypothetical protein